MLAWYDGYDMAKPDEKYKWQFETLNILTGNKTVASVRVDKLKGLTAEQKKAVEAAQEHGSALAMAHEEETGSTVSFQQQPSKSTFY
jgi:hypothetical protein